MSNVSPLRRWPQLEEQFNTRQTQGWPSDDLIGEMVVVILRERLEKTLGTSGPAMDSGDAA